jgi:hypothetical protein
MSGTPPTLNEMIEQGIEQGERTILLRLLTRKLGNLPDTTRTQIEALSGTQVEALADALLGLDTLANLDNWLAQTS